VSVETHGLFGFSTARESLNTFFIADFMFKAVAAIERQRGEALNTGQSQPKAVEQGANAG
jgi:hypothetical protein